jgi:hypothetical protein
MADLGLSVESLQILALETVDEAGTRHLAAMARWYQAANRARDETAQGRPVRRGGVHEA